MRVALFATCLIDTFRPSIGFATLKLLEAAGCEVDVPLSQTCCGQPAYNSGDVKNARAIAKQTMEMFGDYSHVVIPSGSCAGMLTKHYPQLFHGDPVWLARAQDFAGRCYELIEFLHDVLHVSVFPTKYDGTVTYHDSCSSLREIKSSQKARNLLRKVETTTFSELPNAEVCCGFGGTFSVKFPDISGRIVDDKVASIESTDADMLLSADLGCLLNIAGRMKRLNKSTRVFHIAEFLAGMAEGPGIGENESEQDASR